MFHVIEINSGQNKTKQSQVRRIDIENFIFYKYVTATIIYNSREN